MAELITKSFLGLFQILFVALVVPRISICSAILMINQYNFFDLMQPVRYFDLCDDIRVWCGLPA